MDCLEVRVSREFAGWTARQNQIPGAWGRGEGVGDQHKEILLYYEGKAEVVLRHWKNDAA